MKSIKRSIYISGIIVSIGILIALFVTIKLYNKPHINVYTSAPDHTVSVKKLLEAFKADEQQANNAYLDKILQVEGTIKDIKTADGNSVIVIGMQDLQESVICNMHPTENKKTLGLHKGQKITIRGICTGFLLDVILVRAVIIQKQNI